MDLPSTASEEVARIRMYSKELIIQLLRREGFYGRHLTSLPERFGHSLVFLRDLVHELLILLLPLSHICDLNIFGKWRYSHKYVEEFIFVEE